MNIQVLEIDILFLEILQFTLTVCQKDFHSCEMC